MKVDGFELSKQGSTMTLAAKVHSAHHPEALDLWFRIEGVDAPLEGWGDAAAIGLLVVAMYEGEPLYIDAPVSATLLRNLKQAQEVLTYWHDFLQPIQVSAAEVVNDPGEPATGAGCAFSAGVDSWFSVLKHESKVSHLLLVRGFDIGLANDTLWAKTRDRISGIADKLGKRLVTCETNLRVIGDKNRAPWGKRFQGDFWGKCFHGASLISVATLLQGTLGSFILPSSHTFRCLIPWGSSPLLDPHFSNGRLVVVHDGCEATRVHKVREVARRDLVLETLRVCFYDEPAYNCGRCEKCLRTMMALRLCGALDRAQTFPHNVRLSRIEMTVLGPQLVPHYEDLRSEAQRVGDADLLKAVEVALGHRSSPLHTIAVARRVLRANSLGKHIDTLATAFSRLVLPGNAGQSH
jgi:hypothetical protein